MNTKANEGIKTKRQQTMELIIFVEDKKTLAVEHFHYIVDATKTNPILHFISNHMVNTLSNGRH
jgi:hypothetical protein